MPFRLEIAQPGDATRVTQIHMDAFSSNAIIRAIHSVDKDLKDWRKSVEKKALADIHDEKTTVLVVRYQEEDRVEMAHESSAETGNRHSDIIGFAKWTHPFRPEDGYTPPVWIIPESTDQRILRPWLDQVQKVEADIIGETPRYELTYLAIDARYAKQGAGTMLVQWALDLCEAHGYPAYVESTVEAVPFYEKMGFKIAGRIRLDLGRVTDDADAGLYEEVGCIYSPAKN